MHDATGEPNWIVSLVKIDLAGIRKMFNFPLHQIKLVLLVAILFGNIEHTKTPSLAHTLIPMDVCTYTLYTPITTL